MAVTELSRLPGVDDEPECVALLGASAAYWRDKFGQFPNLRGEKPFGPHLRAKLAELHPPFFPEDELVIWDCLVMLRAAQGEFVIQSVKSNRLRGKIGFVFGTNHRLIWGHGNRNVVAEMHYSEIYGLFQDQQGEIHIQTRNNELLTIRTCVGSGTRGWFSRSRINAVSQQWIKCEEYLLLYHFLQEIADFNNLPNQ